MGAEIIFEEQQKFRRWLKLIVLALNLLFIVIAYYQLILGIPAGSNPASDLSLVIILIFTVLFTLFFFSLQLQTQITKDEIKVRFYPFHRKFQRYPWDQISRFYIRQYRPIMEYGGWGIRYGFGRKGKALNVSGNMGLQLEFNDGKKLLIGTNKVNELEVALQHIKGNSSVKTNQ